MPTPPRMTSEEVYRSERAMEHLPIILLTIFLGLVIAVALVTYGRER
jgi:hypothetical protein